ncbi:MAG: cytochrome c biogenesis protein CcsA [Phycisphaeraceae bacterium]|nr:cytochrome c biogenesis protein CcsA [Phycisphaeraceae bacterium]
MTLRLAVLLLLAALVSRAARAQDAPEGNAHPEVQVVADGGEDDAEPFGAMEWTRARTEGSREQILSKIEFARRVDLSPLRALAVQNGGRVKILDTLARETVATITGRARYREDLPAQDQEPAVRYDFDPLFTLLDLVIDAPSYANRPLIHVEYLPLRQALLEEAFPVPAGATEAQASAVEHARARFLQLTRVTPAMVERHARAVYERNAFDQPFVDALNRVDAASSLWRESGRNLLLVAPESKDLPWLHVLDSYPRSEYVRSSASRLGDAWRAHDHVRVNEAIASLVELLPTIHEDVYPGSRRRLELAYNRLNAFTWGSWLYLFAFVGLLVAVGTGRRAVLAVGVALLIGAIGMHGLGFGARCLIAQRWAIQNQFESMTGVSLFASVLALVLMVARRQWLFGAAAAACGFLILITATQARIPGQSIGREAAILNTSVLLKYHVTTVLTSYGLIALGFILSLFFLATHYGGRLRARVAGTDAEGAGSASSSPKRTLRDLDRATMIILQLAFWTLGVGILLGAWWADHSWGRWWAFDPKETWALATWIIYLIVIHVRLVARRRELITAWLSVLGFFVMLWTYFGVNLLLPGLHAYA